LPEIDKQVAELFGITERMVRKCRTDTRLHPFMPHPVWLERDWVKTARQDFEARQVAKRLMTPERYAKGEPVRLFNGGLQVPCKVGLEWEIILGPTPPGARCSFFESRKRMPTDREARAQRAMRQFAERVAAWKRKRRALWPPAQAHSASATRGFGTARGGRDVDGYRA
jgi:hypothetical protein